MSCPRSAGHCRIGASASLDLSNLEELGNRDGPKGLRDSQLPEHLHLDIIDGQFFSPVTFGSEMVKSLRSRLPNVFLDVHMMVDDPLKWVDKIANAGANQFTFHIETTENPSELIDCVRDKSMKVGIAIKPATPVEDILPFISKVDMVLVMTAEPGSKGQEFTENPSLKVEAIHQACPDLEVKTDGWWVEPSRSHEDINRSANQHSSSARQTTQTVVTFEPTRDPLSSPTCMIRSYGTVSCPASDSGGGGAFHSPKRGRGKRGGAFGSESQPLIVNSPVRPGNSQQSKDGSVQCVCHPIVEDKTAKRAKIKLVLASVIALLFVIGEVLGGYFAGSLAIMTDAAHMLSDFAGFLISLFAIWLASSPSSSKMSFGWHRAEVMGAVVSVLIIWVVTGVLFYEAVQRVIHPREIDANIMLITACVGVFVNVFMCMVLHPHSHDHGHGHGKKKRRGHSEEEGGAEACGDGRVKKRKFWQRKKSSHKHGSEENINVRAAFIHVIGDLIQSIGVVIAGYIIWFKPTWTIADPICTFIFCILVLISTLNVLKDALRVLMEGTPKHINYSELKEDLEEIDGVKKAHSLHIWSLTLNRTALAAHLVIESSANHQEVLNQASKMLKEKYNIISTTLQVEDYHDLMESCGTCQETNKTTFCWPL